VNKDMLDLKERIKNVDKDVFFSVLSHIGDKWSLVLLGMLSHQPLRYTELAERIPKISRRMLTVTLRQLERDGLVERQAHSGSQPWFEYALTELGQTLIVPVKALADWALDNIEGIIENRETYDAENASS
jgi:DNA-binding HxlR family transcriptional regulator